MALYHFKVHHNATSINRYIRTPTLAVDIASLDDFVHGSNSSSPGLSYFVRELGTEPSMTTLNIESTATGIRPRRKANRLRQSNNNMTDLDNTILITDEPSCIDLTEDDEVIEIQSPNNTTNNDAPIQNESENVEIVASTSTITLRSRNVPRHSNAAGARDPSSPRANVRNRLTVAAVVNLSQESDDDLPEVCLESSPKGTNKKKLAKETNEKYPNKSISSIVCPICLDDSTDVKNSSRQMVSTICGHLFCDTCLKNCFEAQKCCPTCRKKLKKNQFHPIYF